MALLVRVVGCMPVSVVLYFGWRLGVASPLASAVRWCGQGTMVPPGTPLSAFLSDMTGPPATVQFSGWDTQACAYF